jgi:hypothetical protein
MSYVAAQYKNDNLHTTRYIRKPRYTMLLCTVAAQNKLTNKTKHEIKKPINNLLASTVAVQHKLTNNTQHEI